MERDRIGIALLYLKSERVPIKRCTSFQVSYEQHRRDNLVKHCFHLFFLCRVITESMLTMSHAPLSTRSGARRLCSTSNSVAEKEGQNFSDLALNACRHLGHLWQDRGEFLKALFDGTIYITSFVVDRNSRGEWVKVVGQALLT